jgi:diacylglycerol kinase (ATP)
VLYKVTALQQLFRYPGITPVLESPAHGSRDGRRLIVTISNGRFFGGGFPIAPGATVEDGLLHACVIADAGPFRRAALFNQAERGRHLASPEVELLSDRRFVLRFPEAGPRFEVDGDVYGVQERSVEVEILPGAIELVTP